MHHQKSFINKLQTNIRKLERDVDDLNNILKMIDVLQQDEIRYKIKNIQAVKDTLHNECIFYSVDKNEISERKEMDLIKKLQKMNHEIQNVYSMFKKERV